MTTIACLFVFLVCAWAQTPKAPLWPTVPNPSANFLFTIQSFYAPNTITAFDVNSTAHIHKSIMYYYYDNGVKGERHDHFGYCYGWGNEDCTILIIGNVYIVKKDLCCIAMHSNAAVPPNWLETSTFLGVEVIDGKKVNHWYGFEHEYWSAVEAPYHGVRYAGPNFQTPKQFTNYQRWVLTPLNASMFQLPQNVDCSQTCP